MNTQSAKYFDICFCLAFEKLLLFYLWFNLPFTLFTELHAEHCMQLFTMHTQVVCVFVCTHQVGKASSNTVGKLSVWFVS